jgi:hypothetical protein
MRPLEQLVLMAAELSGITFGDEILILVGAARIMTTGYF